MGADKTARLKRKGAKAPRRREKKRKENIMTIKRLGQIGPVGLALASLLLAPDTHARVFVATNSTWSYFKGTNEASTPTNAWRQLEFDDTAWLVGAGPFFYRVGVGK